MKGISRTYEDSDPQKGIISRKKSLLRSKSFHVPRNYPPNNDVPWGKHSPAIAQTVTDSPIVGSQSNKYQKSKLEIKHCKCLEHCYTPQRKVEPISGETSTDGDSGNYAIDREPARPSDRNTSRGRKCFPRRSSSAMDITALTHSYGNDSSKVEAAKGFAGSSDNLSQFQSDRDPAASRSLQDSKMYRRSNGELDDRIKPKYSGYKPADSIRFIPFKNLFSKPASSVDEDAPSDTEEPKENVRQIGDYTRSLSSNQIYISVPTVSKKCLSRSVSECSGIEGAPELAHSASNLSGKDRLIISNTRKQLKEKIQSANRRRQVKSSKIPINIFMDVNPVANKRRLIIEPEVSINEPKFNKLEFNEIKKQQIRINPRIIRRSAKERPKTSLQKQSSSGEVRKLNMMKDQDVQTLISINANYREENIAGQQPVLEFPKNDEHFTELVTKEPPLEPETPLPKKKPQSSLSFLASVLNDMKFLNKTKGEYIQSNNYTVRGNDKGHYNHIGDYNINEESYSTQAHNEEMPLKRKSYSATKRTYPVSSNNVSVPSVQMYHKNEKATQNLRKKVEEANELHRRLHFCGVSVSKETVFRALMTPLQYKTHIENS